jgi:hypothetical protein
LALLALLAAALCWPILLGGQAFYYYDTNAYMMPLLKWSHQSLAAGHDPAWDGSTLCGMSALDSSLNACLYPPLRALAWAFDAILAMGLLVLGHLILAAWGAYALVRHHGLGAGPALLGAITAAFAGGMLQCPSAWPIFVSCAYLPWMLLGLRLCQEPAPRRWRLGAAVLGLSTGYSFLGGYPGMALYALMILGWMHGLWLAGAPATRLRARSAWAALALAALITAGLYAGQALALRRGSAASARGHGLSVAQAEEGSLSPAAALGLVLPHGLGRRADDSFSGASWRFGTYEPCGTYLYVGLISLLLLLLGLAYRPRQALPYALAWAALAFYALGRWNPIYPWLLRLPLLGYLRAPAKAVFFSGVLAAVPVAWGAQAVADRDPRWARAAARLAVAVALALALGCLALQLGWGRLLQAGEAHLRAKVLGDPLHQLSLQAYLGRLTRVLANLRWQLWAQAAWAGALALALWAARRGRLTGLGLALALAGLAYGELAMNARAQWMLIDRAYYQQEPATAAWIQAHADPAAPVRSLSWGGTAALRRVFPDGRPAGRLPQELELNEALPPNAQRSWGLDFSNGYAPLWPQRLQPLLGWIRDGDPELEAHGLERLRQARAALDLSATRWVVSSVALDLPGLALRRDGDVRIYENLDALPMAYIAGHSDGSYDAASAWAALSAPRAGGAGGPRLALLEDGSAPAQGRGSVRWVSHSDDRWELDAQVDSPGGVLVLARPYYPGPWAATVDGRPAELLPANAAFCALRLGQGGHHVRVAYQDPLLPLAWRLQWAGSLLALALLLWAWRSPGEAP